MAGYCTYAFAKQILGLADDTQQAQVEGLIEVASDFIDSMVLRYPIGTRLWKHQAIEYLDFKFEQKVYQTLFPKNTPIISLDKIEWSALGENYEDFGGKVQTYAEFIKVSFADFSIFNAPSPVYWTTKEKMPKAFKLTMQVGLFEQSAIPYDLQFLCANIVRQEFSRIYSTEDLKEGIKSKKIGDFSVTYNTETVAQSALNTQGFNDLLDKYRNPIQFG